MRLLVTLGASLVLSCSGGGSGQQGPGGPGGVGDTHHDLDTGGQPPADAGAGGGPTPVDGGAAVIPPPPPAALVTVELKNTGTTDLELNVDKGWSIALSGFSGTPPKAKAILIFPRWCTVACDAADTCPKCEAPEKASDETKQEQRVVIPPGQSHTIEWDGNVHVYQKVAGKKGCDCYTKQMVPPESYTLRSCGLRVTKSADQRTKMQCVDQKVQLPPDKPTRVIFEFPQPPPKSK
jgi:hypothetical protein